MLELRELAVVDHLPLCRMSSADVTIASMHGLSGRVTVMLAHDDTNGLVAVHGTNTMEGVA